MGGKIQRMKLNMGCGNDIRKDCVNLDVVPLKGVDVVHDLNKFPFPFKENTFDVVYAFGVLEHLPSTVKIVEELHRICKNGAKIYVSVPFWNCSNSHEDPTHVKFFSYDTFGLFEEGHFNNHYTKARLKVLKVKITGIRILPDFIKKFLSEFIGNVVVKLDYTLEVVKK